jgi:uncharacterized damage-inducible protein DinB
VNIERLFLSYSIEKLGQLEGRIESCLDRLSKDQVWWRGSEESNSIANLTLHLCGNVRQWILSSIDGQPDCRQRDAEFAARGDVTVAELRAKLKNTIEEATKALERVTPQRLGETIHVQGYEKTVLEAIYHVVEHFSLHTGQIIYATKLLRNEDLGFYKHLKNPAHKETIP